MTAITEPAQKVGRAEKAPGSRFANAVTWAAVVFGALLRVARFVHFRCLWLDEIYLAGSIVHRSMHDLLFQPLDNWQAAPAGYLILVHLAMIVFGTGESALRLVSLVFGVASLPLMWGVARRMLGGWGVAVAMGMFSVLGPLVYYSNEVKPYSCDVAVALGIMLAVLWWEEERTAGRAVVAGIVGAIGVFLSYPAIFVLGGVGCWVLLFGHLRSKAPPPLPSPRDLRSAVQGEGERRSAGFLLMILVWAVAFAGNYFLFVRPYAIGDAHWHVVQYWVARDAFMPRSMVDAVYWIFSSLDAIARDPGAMWLDYPDAALIGLIVGVAVAARGRGKLLIAVAPLPLVLVAAALRQYPFGDRLALFFVPGYLLLIAGAAEALWGNFAGKVAAVAIVGLILLPSGKRALGYLFSPHGREESLPVYQWAAADYRPGDVVYLSPYAELSFDYYAGRAGWPVDLRSAGAVHVQRERMRPEEIVADVDACEGRRVWVILIHPELGEYDVQGLTVAEFDRIGHVISKRVEIGALGYLYDCTGKAD